MTSCSHSWAMQPVENSVHSERKEFAPRGVDPDEMGGKNEKKNIAFPESVPIQLKYP